MALPGFGRRIEKFETLTGCGPAVCNNLSLLIGQPDACATLEAGGRDKGYAFGGSHWSQCDRDQLRLASCLAKALIDQARPITVEIEETACKQSERKHIDSQDPLAK